MSYYKKYQKYKKKYLNLKAGAASCIDDICFNKPDEPAKPDKETSYFQNNCIMEGATKEKINKMESKQKWKLN